MLAIVPVIPVFVAAISVVPIVIGIITNATKLSDKKSILRYHHRKFKVLLCYVQGENTSTEQQLIKEVFKQITEIHSAVDYSEQIERYIRRYKLKGYDIEADEVQMIKKGSRASLEALEISEPQIIKTTVNKLNFV